MGLWDDVAELIQEAEDRGYIDEAMDKYDFTDFGDATTCCDTIERAVDINNMVKAMGYSAALSAALQYAHGEGIINDKYILKIYKYCCGMDYDFMSSSLMPLLSFLDIDY